MCPERESAVKKIECPCGSGHDLADCCGRWHAGLTTGVHAPTPEALMRSRYSAYVLGLIDYLAATWHPSTAPGDLELQPVKWLGLEVRHAATAGDVGVVEFVARCRVNGRAERMHELSRFVREQGRWYYIDGQLPQEN
ncbi:MAG: SEC-C domain-containing protein [Rhodoferax sp.]|nr:SEC-C domain-containing protein [Rhodoferax sp.]